jgi:hypothetical protein
MNVFPLFVKSNLRVRFILRGSLQQLTFGFYEGLKLKWEILTTARLNGTINRNFNSFYGKFRGHTCISYVFGNFFHFDGVNMEDILTSMSISYLKHSKFKEHLGNTPYFYV